MTGFAPLDPPLLKIARTKQRSSNPRKAKTRADHNRADRIRAGHSFKLETCF